MKKLDRRTTGLVESVESEALETCDVERHKTFIQSANSSAASSFSLWTLKNVWKNWEALGAVIVQVSRNKEVGPQNNDSLVPAPAVLDPTAKLAVEAVNLETTIQVGISVVIVTSPVLPLKLDSLSNGEKKNRREGRSTGIYRFRSTSFLLPGKEMWPTNDSSVGRKSSW